MMQLNHAKSPIVLSFNRPNLVPVNESKLYKSESVYENNNPFAYDENHTNAFAWLRSDDCFFIAPVPTDPILPPGYYTVQESMQGYYLKKKRIAVDELYLLPDPNLELIAGDIQHFWTKKADYERYKITYKRAILMHGKQGNGKTSVINWLIKKIVEEHKGYVFDYGYGAEEMMRKIRAMHPAAHMMVIMEEVDTLMNYDGHRVLNFLDGTNSIPDVVTLGTTNYLDRLEPRIINRPSRFDRVIEIPVPIPAVRKFFLEHKMLEEDKQKHNIAQWVQDTQGLTLSHLKELVVSVCVLGKDYHETLQIMKDMNGD